MAMLMLSAAVALLSRGTGAADQHLPLSGGQIVGLYALLWLVSAIVLGSLGPHLATVSVSLVAGALIMTVLYAALFMVLNHGKDLRGMLVFASVFGTLTGCLYALAIRFGMYIANRTLER